MRIINILVLVLLCYLLKAQVPVGLKYDCNGQAFNGYFDLINYVPNEKVSEIHNSDSYEAGYYFDSLGNEIPGLIKFQDKKIWFKKDDLEFGDKIKPAQVKSLVIGVDSFFMIDKYFYQNTLKKKPVYVQHIAQVNGNEYAKHYHFRSMVMQGQEPIVETYLVKDIDKDIWENLTNRNLKGLANKYFNHIPYLKEKIATREYTSDDVLSIIKMTDYYEKYKKQQPIFYDKYWQETKNYKIAAFKAVITNKVDSIWTFDYFKDSLKLYTINYTSFYPHNKNGLFTAYHNDGTIRQTIFYKNDKPTEVKIFNESRLVNHYNYIRKTISDGDEFEVKYVLFTDSLGNNVIDKLGKKTVKVYDNYSKASYEYRFNDNKLELAYKLRNNDTVLQITNSDFKYKLKRIQSKFTYFMSERSYDNALEQNAQGTILVNFLIDSKGNVLDVNRVSGIHPELDKLVDIFVKSYFSPKTEFPIKLKPYKFRRKKYACEVLIPFEFGINRFYRPPAMYHYHFHHHMYMHNQMIHHMQPPSVPVRF